MPNRICDPHMFHGILWLTPHEEKYPLTTDTAATRESTAAVKSVTVPPSEMPTMPRRAAGSTSGCCCKDVEGSAEGVPRCSAPGESSRPWRHGRGWCRRRSGPRGSSPVVRRSSEGRAPARRRRAAPVAAHSRRWACRCAPTRRPASCPARGRGRRGRPGPGGWSNSGVGDAQVGGDRHGVLGVEDDLVPAIAVTGPPTRASRGRAAPHQGSGPRSSARRGPSTAQPSRGEGRGVVLGQRVFVGRGGQPGHPLVPGGVVAGRRGQDEPPVSSLMDGPFLAARTCTWLVDSGIQAGRTRP